MSGRFTAGVFIVVVSVVAVALVWTGVRDYESFTPPVAMAVDRADCLAPDITAALVAPEARDSSIALRPEGSGYPPPDFSPVAVVRCERGETSDGGLTIDSIRLEGDIHAVDDCIPRTVSSISCQRPGRLRVPSRPASRFVAGRRSRSSQYALPGRPRPADCKRNHTQP